MKFTQERPARRAYDASGRRRKAEARRISAVRAAAEVFAERGVEAATMAELAEVAGVSVPYLERLGTKAEIFAMSIEAVTLGPELNTLANAQDEFEKIADSISRDELLDSFARGSAEWNARSHRLWRMWAVSSDPELQERWRTLMADVRQGWATSLTMFDERGWWRTDISRADQAATIWILTMAETYGRLTEEAGFTHDEYVAWLRRGLDAVLVPPLR